MIVLAVYLELDGKNGTRSRRPMGQAEAGLIIRRAADPSKAANETRAIMGVS
jgi:hypothetical protein